MLGTKRSRIKNLEIKSGIMYYNGVEVADLEKSELQPSQIHELTFVINNPEPRHYEP